MIITIGRGPPQRIANIDKFVRGNFCVRSTYNPILFASLCGSAPLKLHAAATNDEWARDPLTFGLNGPSLMILQLMFAALIVLIGIYFVRRRKIDPVTIAFIGCCIYFAPGLVGSFDYDLNGNPYVADMELAAYVTMTIVIFFVMTTAIILDKIPSAGPFCAQFDRLFAPVLLVIMLTAFAVSLCTVGAFYLCTDKNDMLRHIDVWYFTASAALTPCAIAATINRQFAIVLICGILLAGDIFVGFRANAAIVLLSALVIYGHRLFEGIRPAIGLVTVVLLCGVSLIFVKQMIYTLKYASGHVCERALALEKARIGDEPQRKPEQHQSTGDQSARPAGEMHGSNFVLQTLKGSEPFVTQTILNETIRASYTTDSGYLLDQLLTAVPGAYVIFGLNVRDVPVFGYKMQKDLFPQVTNMGMASNPWAQAYAAGRLPLVAIFAISFVIVVGGLSWAARSTGGALSGCLVVLAVWLAFYFHRNDILIQIGLMKIVFYTIVAAILAAAAISRVRKLCTPS